MTMVDKYLATEMFEFNSLSQFSIALFTYHGLVVYVKARAFKAKAIHLRPRPRNLALRPRFNIPAFQTVDQKVRLSFKPVSSLLQTTEIGAALTPLIRTCIHRID